ncbi:MAG: hypothetical protein IPN29_00130 [Saprospiraceae bacterium]|nr:hypothetical protein [Saprospiraceae bacterium]
MKFNFKPLLPYALAIAVILVINLIYFMPQFQGKVPDQGDIIQYSGMAQEAKLYLEKTGEETLWTNSMFGGMPTYQIAASNPSNLLRHAQYVLYLGMDRPAGYFFFGMLSFFILMSVMGMGPWMSLLGAIMFGLSTNHYILFEAGHTSKIVTIFTAPLMMAGIWLLNKRSYLYGAAIFTLGAGLNLYANHPQMTYYLAMVLAIYVVVEFINAAKAGEWLHIGKVIAIYVLGSGLALGASWSKISSTLDYTKDTMRGKPILTKKGDGTEEAKKGEGLEYDYAMQWSNGVMDLVSAAVPLAAGGSSVEWVKKDNKLAKILGQNKSFQAPTYWGDLPFTSGPAYIGIVAIFLFVFAMFAVNHWIRWWLLSGVVLTFIISMGKNFAAINDIFYYYLPYFNRFRTPNSVLSVTTILVPMLAAFGLHTIIHASKERKEALIRSLWIATGITAGFCALLALLGPSMFSFTNEANDEKYKDFIEPLIDLRKEMMSSSSWKSVFLILATAGPLWLYLKQKISTTMLLGLVALLVVIDLFPTDKNYLSEKDFVTKRAYQNNFTPRLVDEQILSDKDPNFRVYDASINTFNQASASYFHKTIGGYSAVKLQRMQDVIERQIAKGNQRVLDMLNTKYFIMPGSSGQEGQEVAQRNPLAYGNAWVVDTLVMVNTADEEIQALDSIERRKGIIHQEFKDYVSTINPTGEGEIKLTSYAPNALSYSATVPTDQLAVFSEVWYGPNKGWIVTIDGKEVEHIRANFLLRALKIPAGSHEIKFEFKPQVYYRGEKISLASSSAILVLCFIALFFFVRNNEKEA